ncbi:RrF2 family transcriptional regulator [Sediminispirochaeta smaragdinae]|uniref:Transcriptional regulator, BadM/Rrf2 family n=1 Tax=Sediminispirochaeta smaragdinae (strain DSM 11293 / JCM 15392 / SEBR 4228) TaxID=573413 RepID=E1R7P9_SEDSS|nr:Rrf2 family transcriptional regulator [Sediminispirochaeta smaragdinae]ADK82754.1 transcriptional regulator, BadM/Rrf2 family [Sediminispirochaeta smaragdinae DSM 11293]
MRITTKGRYAIRAVLRLAQAEEHRPIPIRILAAQEGISPEFLEQIFFRLRKSGIINSTRGPGGGFRLMKEANDLTLMEIFDAVEEGFFLSPCTQDGEQCDREERCLVHGLWEHTYEMLQSYFGAITIADVMANRYPHL